MKGKEMAFFSGLALLITFVVLDMDGKINWSALKPGNPLFPFYYYIMMTVIFVIIVIFIYSVLKLAKVL